MKKSNQFLKKFFMVFLLSVLFLTPCLSQSQSEKTNLTPTQIMLLSNLRNQLKTQQQQLEQANQLLVQSRQNSQNSQRKIQNLEKQQKVLQSQVEALSRQAAELETQSENWENKFKEAQASLERSEERRVGKECRSRW